MTCLDVRERLAEHALDALPDGEAQEVERHLAQCVACRREAHELRDGAARLGSSLPMRVPDPSLESKVVERVAAVAGKRRPASRRRVRVAAGAALLAAMLALGSLTWAIAQRDQVLRDQVKSLRTKVSRTNVVIGDFARLVKALQTQIRANGDVFDAQLVPAAGSAGGGGAAVIVVTPRADDLITVKIDLPATAIGPFHVLMEGTSSAKPIDAGALVRTQNGDYVLANGPQFFAQDLSRLTAVVVVARSGRTILRGPVRPYTAPTPANPNNGTG